MLRVTLIITLSLFVNSCSHSSKNLNKREVASEQRLLPLTSLRNINLFQRFRKSRANYKCLEAICGEAKDSLSYENIQVIEPMTAIDEQFINQQIEKIFTYVDMWEEHFKLKDSFYRLAAAAKDDVQPANEELRLKLILSQYFGVLYKFDYRFLGRSKSMRKYNLKQIRPDDYFFESVTRGLPYESVRTLLDLLRSSFLFDEYFDILSLQNGSIAELVGSQGNAHSVEQALKKLVEKIKKNITKYKESLMWTDMETAEHFSNLNRMARGIKSVDRALLSNYLVNINIFKIVDTLDESKRKKLLNYKLVNKSEITQFIHSAIYKGYIKYFSDDKLQEEGNALLRKKLKILIANLLNSKNSRLKVERFESLLRELKDLAKQELKLANTISTSLFAEAIESLPIDFEKFNLNKVKSNFESSVNLLHDNLAAELVFLKSDPNKLKDKLLKGVLYQEFRLHDAIEFDFPIENLPASLGLKYSEAYSDLLSIDPVFKDFAEASLSWATVRHPEVGLGIAAHEIAHYVYYLLHDPFYQRYYSEASLVDKYKTPKKYGMCMATWHKGEGLEQGQFLEEDWADYFSSLLIRKMKNRHPWLGNHGCGLLNNINNEYIGLSLKVPKWSEAVHSSGFFRVLHIESVLSDKLPEVCQKVIRKKKLFQCQP